MTTHNHPPGESCFQCDNGPGLTYEEIERLMKDFGHAVMGVAGTIPWAYTIGLWRKNLPELIVSGMNQAQAMITLNTYAEFTEKIKTFSVGDTDTDMFTRPTRFGHVSEKNMREYMAQAIYHQGFDPGKKALQVLWPDRRGVFAYQPGYQAERFPQQLFNEE